MPLAWLIFLHYHKVVSSELISFVIFIVRRLRSFDGSWVWDRLERMFDVVMQDRSNVVYRMIFSNCVFPNILFKLDGKIN